MGLLTWIDVR